MKRINVYLLPALLAVSCSNPVTSETETATPLVVPEVLFAGAMRDVMHKGELAGRVDLDTLADQKHLYAVGPVEFLKGEITVADGRCYVSRVQADSTMQVEETFAVKAPFFVYSNVETWYEAEVPDSVRDIRSLERFLDALTVNSKRPFAFRIEASVDSADIHVVNLPDGTDVHSPEEAHFGQQNYHLAQTEVELVGFFSTRHAGVFTHHDSFVHIHLLTADRSMMGHLDAVSLIPGTVKLYLPEDIE